MTNIAKYLQRNTSPRPNVVQIRLSDDDKQRLEDLANKHGVRPTRLLYEMFKFCIDLCEKEEKQMSE